jgi:elongation of very long chain fatty acids protein 1
MKTPLPYTTIFLVYFLVIFRIAPAYMKNRKPMNISAIIQGYNVFQVVACAYFVWKFHDNGFSFQQTWRCVVDVQPSSKIDFYNTGWWFMMLRTVELVETVFFILRKKQNQVSTLHVYHHVSTIVLMWLNMKYKTGKEVFCIEVPFSIFSSIPGMMPVFIVAINSCVHIIMYTFYFCSTVKGLSIVVKVVKPFLTSIQLIQLVAILIHCIVAVSPSCGASNVFYVQILNILILIGFFAKFFVESYMKPMKSRVE